MEKINEKVNKILEEIREYGYYWEFVMSLDSDEDSNFWHQLQCELKRYNVKLICRYNMLNIYVPVETDDEKEQEIEVKVSNTVMKIITDYLSGRNECTLDSPTA